MDLLMFDYSLGHSRYMEDDSFGRSTRYKWHDYNSEIAKKKKNLIFVYALLWMKMVLSP